MSRIFRSFTQLVFVTRCMRASVPVGMFVRKRMGLVHSGRGGGGHTQFWHVFTRTTNPVLKTSLSDGVVVVVVVVAHLCPNSSRIPECCHCQNFARIITLEKRWRGGGGVQCLLLSPPPPPPSHTPMALQEREYSVADPRGCNRRPP